MAKDMILPPAVILAGGLARRMGGQDKAFVTLGGRPMIDHVIERITPQVGHLAISANGDPRRFGKKRPVLSDSFDDWPGPLAGVLAAMDWATAVGSQWVITVATDTPFLPTTLVSKLIRAQITSAAPIVQAESADGVQPVTALWFTDLADSLRDSLISGTRKVTDFTDAKDSVTALFPDADFFNVNTPEDLAQAESRLLGR